MDVKSLVLVLTLLFLCAERVTSRRRYRKAEAQLEEWQKRYLEKIQLLAREGGLKDWKSITKYDDEVCYEKECLASALEFMEATNFTANPCTSWLGYTCARRVNGPDNINQLERLMRVVEQQTKSLLLGAKPEDVPENFLLKEAQTYYYQCKNKQLYDGKDVKDILKYLETTYGGWPMMTNADPGPKFNWFKMLADLNRIERVGFKPAIFTVSFSTSSKNIFLELGQTTFSTSQKDFVEMMTRIQKASGEDKPARLDQLAKAVQLVSQLASASYTQADYSELTIEQLQEKTDEFLRKRKATDLFEIDWLKFFQTVLDGSDIEVTSSSPKVYLPFGQVKDVITSIIRAYKNNDKRSVSNLLNFQLATLLLQESTTLLDDLNSFNCNEESGSRENICYARTTEIFGYSLGKSYLSKFYNEDVDTPGIEELMAKIQQGYINFIDDLSYMEESTKEFLRDKIRHMKTYIAEPDWTKDPEKLHQFYETLTASADKNSSFPLNYLNVTSWQVAKKRGWTYRMASLTSVKDVDIYDIEWSRYLGNVQAQFHKIFNQARIEGGIVHSPIFAVDRPGFMNYGGLGMVLAHEIGHSYDTQGRMYNKDREQGEFWDPVSKIKYDEWVQTVLKEYGSAEHRTSATTKETVNPYKTLNEDISDILAIHISYLSYKEYLKELEEQGKSEKVLPGLKTFSPQKLFYMKYANMWCDKKDTQDHFNELLADHSPGNIRATLPLKGSKLFAETFGCKLPKKSS